MFNQTFPTSPFIYYYDDKYEIRERDRRLKRKVREIQKNGDFPKQFKRPNTEQADKRRHHGMRKSQTSKKSRGWLQANKETRKEMNRNREHERHRQADRHQETDEYFPRGSKPNSSGRVKTQKPPKSFHRSPHYHKLRADKLPRESKPNKQKKREQRTEDGGDEDLLLIKQRRKKSKL